MHISTSLFAAFHCTNTNHTPLAMPAVDVQGLDKLPVPEPVKFESLGQDVWFANAAAATATGPNDPDVC